MVCQAVVNVLPAPFVIDDPRLSQQAKLLRDIRLRLAQQRLKMADALRVAAHGVARPAGPLTTFAIGFAAGLSTGIATDSSAGEPDTTAAVRELSTKASALVSSWRPEVAGTAEGS